MDSDRRRDDDTRAALREGMLDALPIMLGVVPFGLVAGIAAVEAGIGLEGAVTASVLIFAGASQLAALDLLGRDAPVLVVVLTVLVINARLVMYSAAVAPVLAHEPRGRRLLAAYFLVDQAFALTVARAGRPTARGPHLAYYAGFVLPLWVNWQAWTVAGALLGATIPDWLPLAATVPLVFLVVLVPVVSDVPTVVAAVVSGVTATLAAGLPANAGLLVGATAGIVAGAVVASRVEPADAAAPPSGPRQGVGHEPDDARGGS